MLDFKRPPKVALAAVLLATCALAGCVVGPNYHAPPSGDLGVPQAYGIAAAPAQPVDITVWWKQLNDPLLTEDELFERALRRPREPYDRSVDVHVSNLRQKLAAAGGGVEIETARALGYRLRAGE